MAESILALQLYTVRTETARDLAGTLRRVKEIGYEAIETSGVGRPPLDSMRRILDDSGLKLIGTHPNLTDLESNLEEEIEYAVAFACPNIVIASTTSEQRSDRTLGRRLNDLGRRLRERCLVLSYHNHDFELEKVDRIPLLDRLLNDTDPDLVHLELDVYWAAYAGVDPTDYIRAHADRVRLLHLKDMDPDRGFTEVGDGTLDFAAICRTAQDAGVRYFVTENDNPRIPPLESARRSLENLRALGL